MPSLSEFLVSLALAWFLMAVVHYPRFRAVLKRSSVALIQQVWSRLFHG